MITPQDVITARDRAGMTQQQLADYLGRDVKTIRDFELGKRTRLRSGQAALEDFVAEHLGAAPAAPQSQQAPGGDVARLIAEASDWELFTALQARMVELRRHYHPEVTAAGPSVAELQFLLDNPDKDTFLAAELSKVEGRSGSNGLGTKQIQDELRTTRREELQRALDELRSQHKRAAGQ